MNEIEKELLEITVTKNVLQHILEKRPDVLFSRSGADHFNDAAQILEGFSASPEQHVNECDLYALKRCGAHLEAVMKDIEPLNF